MTCTNCIHKDVCYKIEHYGNDIESFEIEIENVMPKGFSGIWIDREILFQDNLSLNEKVVISIIKSFENEQSECFASNKFFSKLLNLSSKRASEIINGLVAKGFITSEMIFCFDKKAISKRLLKINNDVVYSKANKLCEYFCDSTNRSGEDGD